MSNTNYFLLRRLHSLLGVIPLGIFLFGHLTTNSMGILGTDAFEHKVALIHTLGPFLPLVEAAVIFIPLSIHIALGIYIALQAKMELGLSYKRNWAYNFQRWTGWVAFVYIVYHVLHLRFLHDSGAVPFSFALTDMFSGELAWLYVPLYLIGSLAVIFHFANGLCTFCMTWGITTGQMSQRYLAYAATGVGAILTAMMFASVVGFYREGLVYRQMNDQARDQLIERLVHYIPELDTDAALEFMNEKFPLPGSGTMSKDSM